jgi:hypothetical protein
MTEQARVDNGIVDIIKGAFEGKPVDAEAAFNSAMQAKMGAALQARSDEIRAEIYADEEELEASAEDAEEPEEAEELETEDSPDEDV